MRLLAVGLAFTLLVAACSSDGDEPATGPGPTSDSGETDTTAGGSPGDAPSDDTPTEGTASEGTGAGGTPTTLQEADEPPAEIDLVLRPLVGLVAPIDLAARPGSESLYVAERAGKVLELVIGADGGVSAEPRVVLDIRDRVNTESQRGLLGIAFSPEGDRLYATFSNHDGSDALTSWALGADGTAAPDTELHHLEVSQPFGNHNGAQLVFGPDGYLYYGIGDGGSAGDPHGNGQDRSTLLGSILRIDPDVVSGGYAVPPDNPFVGEPSAATEIWAHGLRHPWRFSFDAPTGDLWIADAGEHEREEINLLPAAAGAGSGVNLGWNAFEGTFRFADVEAPGHVPPLLEYTHDDGRCSVIGGFVYRGTAIPLLDGIYLYSDYCDGVIRGLVPGVGSGPLVAGGSTTSISFGEGPDGELYFIEENGTVSRLEAQVS